MAVVKHTRATQEIEAASKAVDERKAALKKTKLYRDHQAEIRKKRRSTGGTSKDKRAAEEKRPRRGKKRGPQPRKKSDDIMDKGRRLPGSGWTGENQK